MLVAIIGSGNVATVLGKMIKASRHTVVEVVSREIKNADRLAKELAANANADLNTITKNADIYVVAVSDFAISEIAHTVRIPGKIVVHTSGAVPKNVLQKISGSYGVLYPLQSIRKETLHIPVIPFLTDGNNDEIDELISSFAKTLSPVVKKANDEERLKLHIAAVVVSNFTNHLYALAKDFCDQQNTDFKLLVPLIQEVANRTADYDPETMQTGPAIRDDAITIERHLKVLSGTPHLQKLYNYLTESIRRFHSI